jgi:hypothetical protein
MCLKKVAYRSPPPAPVRAPLAERPGSAVRRCNRSRADGAEPRPPNWPTQRRPLLLVGSGVAMPVPRPAPPVSTTFANGAPQGFLWSFAPVSLAGGLLSAVAGFPLCAAFVRRSRFPLLWRWFRETLSEHRVGGRQQEQRVSTPSPQKRKTQKESVEARCRRCRSPCVLASPAAPPGRACSPCVGVAAAGIPPPSPLAAPEENSEKWRLRLPCSAQGLSVGPGQRIQAALVAKVLKGRGHLDVEKVG